jgi:uncharacterized tellurite resistance protein B-like protein
MTAEQWYRSIGTKESVFNAKNPERFKKATAQILCNILHLDSAQQKEELQQFCDLMKKDISIGGEDLGGADQAQLHSNIEAAAQVVKEELDADPVRMMEFMRMLNRFIMVDKCKEEDYCIFDRVRELLFGS